MDDDGGGQFTYKGKININTAEIPVLMALLPEENRDLALAIDEYRLERAGDSYTHELSGATWYKEVPGAGDITIDADLITTASNLFRVVVAAELHGLKMQVTAIVRREEDTESGKFRGRLLSWKLN
jgi:general secretion pathway protein K